MYIPDEEKGGLFFASFSKKDNYITLEIETIVEIKNNVEKEFPGSSRKNSYFPDRRQYLRVLSANFTTDNPSKIKLPIHFHTHPTNDKFEDVKYYSQLLHPLNMSDGDIAVSKTRHIQFNSFSMFYLNSIIMGDENEHRIMFYGNNVTPENYFGEKSKQLFETIKDFTDEIESNGWRIFTRIALAGLGILTVVKAPYLVQPLIDNIVYSLDKKEFWGKLEKDGNTIINIPFRKLNNKIEH